MRSGWAAVLSVQEIPRPTKGVRRSTHPELHLSSLVADQLGLLGNGRE